MQKNSYTVIVMTKFLAITSAKGGVGKTTLALNLATALTGFGREVILVDANLSSPNISLHLGTPKLPITFHDALNKKKHITETAYLHPSGLKVIPASIALDQWDEKHIDKMKDVLFDLIGTAEMVLLDTAPGLGKETTVVMKMADETIVVTTPDLPSVTDALKTIKTAENLGSNVLGIVVNRYSKHPAEMDLKSIEALLERPILGVIPEDQMNKRALALKHPVVYTHPDSAMAVEVKKLAAKLVGQTYREKL